MNPFQFIYQRYVDEASFLWVLRQVALDQPHYSTEDMRELEVRVRRQLAGIMTAPEDAWTECEEALELGDAGEVFTSAVTAFRCGHLDKIQKAVVAGLASENALSGLSSALDFLPGNLCHTWIKKFFTSKEMLHKRLALEACLLRGEDPAAYLTKIISREDCRAEQKLYVSALKAIGQFKRKDLKEALILAEQEEEAGIKFEALKSLILLGEHSLVAKLESYVMNEGEFQLPAIQISFRVLPLVEARKWISRLATAEGMNRAAASAVGVLGDPQAINWLLTQMEEPELAKVTAEAFSTITGLVLEDEGLSKDEPEGEEPSPEDDESFVSLDEDENLPYPNVQEVHRWWRNNAGRFVVGHRYFMGHLSEEAILRKQVQEGMQRRRHQASLELALQSPVEPVHNTYGFYKK